MSSALPRDLSCVLVFVLTACGGGSSAADSGPDMASGGDGSTHDLGGRDIGLDTGALDLGSDGGNLDLGIADAGDTDAGVIDAGDTDAGDIDAGVSDAGCTPSTEVCNGVDDDCNGLVDDGLGTTTCGVGVCRTMVMDCVGGTPQVCVPGSPMTETCNGLDDNCDGFVDNGDPGGGTACSTGLSGVCAVGTTHCLSAVVTCVPNAMASPEVCDGMDNDCNGAVDNGDPGGGSACSTGLAGVCAVGTTHCIGAALSCVQNVTSSAEVCDGRDNDCNGVVDEGDPGGGIACSTGLGGICATGTTHCVSGAVQCVRPAGC